MNKLSIFLVLGILTLGIVSAGLFDFLKKEKEPEPYKPAFNISDNFNTKKNEIKTLPICLKTPENAKCKEKNPNYDLIDVSGFNYFNTNNESITRFTNE